MPRTTLDLDASVLRELKQRRLREGRSIGAIASELLASALASDVPVTRGSVRWIGKPMGARIDLDDKEALYRALDRP